MTHEERTELKDLERTLDTLSPCDEEWNKVYDRYCELTAKRQEEYRALNIGPLKAFYDDRIANREWKDIDPEDWDWYSDYHKDVFGYRPRTLLFLGEIEY